MEREAANTKKRLQIDKEKRKRVHQESSSSDEVGGSGDEGSSEEEGDEEETAKKKKKKRRKKRVSIKRGGKQARRLTELTETEKETLKAEQSPVLGKPAINFGGSVGEEIKETIRGCQPLCPTEMTNDDYVELLRKAAKLQRDLKEVYDKLGEVPPASLVLAEQTGQFVMGDASYICYFCGKQLRSEVTLGNHIEKFHKQKETEPHGCNVCGKRFVTHRAYLDHRRTSCINPASQPCEENCLDVDGNVILFTSEKVLKRHMVLFHSEKAKAFEWETAECSHCHDVGKWRFLYTFKSHEKMCEKKDRLTCFGCQKTFPELRRLTQHLSRNPECAKKHKRKERRDGREKQKEREEESDQEEFADAE